MHAADPGWRRLLDHLADAGPASIDDLRVELRFKRQELNALLGQMALDDWQWLPGETLRLA